MYLSKKKNLKPHCPECLISSGRAGADFGGLVGAQRVGVKTGGFLPRDFARGFDAVEDLINKFSLQWCNNKVFNQSTLENVVRADATFIFKPGNKSSEICGATIICDDTKKPYCILGRLDSRDLIVAETFLNNHKPNTLFITGSREEDSPGIGDEVSCFIEKLFTL